MKTVTAPPRTPVPGLRRRLRYALLSFMALAVIVVATMSIADPRLGVLNLGARDQPLWWFPILGAVFFLVPGVVVLIRSDWHPVGWLLVNLAIGFQFSFGPDAVPVAQIDGVEAWWMWLAHISVSAVFWSVWSLLILNFPDRLPARAGLRRRVGLIVIAVDVVAVLLTALQETIAVQSGGVANPLPWAHVPVMVGEWAAIVPNVLLLVVLVDFVGRYRASVEPDRSSYRWVVWSFLFVAAALIAAICASVAFGDTASPVWLLVVVGYLLVPVAFMVSILRYRLYAIDKVVSRTLTYTCVAVAIALAYAVPVITAPWLLGESNQLVVAGSTLFAAALFNPIRKRVHRAVDRRFDRARFDAERAVEELSGRLGVRLSVDSVSREALDVLGRTLQPDAAGLWIRGKA